MFVISGEESSSMRGPSAPLNYAGFGVAESGESKSIGGGVDDSVECNTG